MFENEDVWRRVERLEQERRHANREQEEALRELHGASLAPCDDRRRSSWRRYCDAVDLLEQTTLELQQLAFAAAPAPRYALLPELPEPPAPRGRHSSR